MAGVEQGRHRAKVVAMQRKQRAARWRGEAVRGGVLRVAVGAGAGHASEREREREGNTR